MDFNLLSKIRKFSVGKNKDIEIWGDGEQTRSYLYIEDCIDAVLKLLESDYHDPINIGSEEQVSINQMVDKIEKISNYKINRNYNPNMPQGVRGRSSNNDLVKKTLNWNPKYSLEQGLNETYSWIESMIISERNHGSIFTMKY